MRGTGPPISRRFANFAMSIIDAAVSVWASAQPSQYRLMVAAIAGNESTSPHIFITHGGDHLGEK
jgi:hypothetical protein